MTTPSDNKRIAVAFITGWMSATVFAAIISRGIPAFSAILASAVMMLLFLFSGFAYNRFIKRKPAEAEPSTLSLEQRCEAFSQLHGLTPRQGEVCLLLVAGKSVNDISDELYISKDTVKTHVKALYAKTDTHSRQELVAAVYGHEA